MAIILPVGWSTFVSGCASCIPSAPDGLTEMDVLFDTGVGFSNRYTWSFVGDNPDGEIIYLAATANPLPVNQQLYKSTNGVTSTETFPTGINSVSNLYPGISDRILFGQNTAGFFRMFTLDNGSQIEFILDGHGYDAQNVRNWSVNGNTWFGGGQELLRDGRFVVAKYDIPTETFVTDLDLPADLIGVQTIDYDGEFVYVLANTTTGLFAIYKYSPQLVLLETFDLTATNASEGYFGIYSTADGFVYYIKRRVFGPPGTAAEIGYIENMNSQVVLDDNVPGTGIPIDSRAWVVWIHTDPILNQKFMFVGGSNEPLIYKFGPIVCAA